MSDEYAGSTVSDTIADNGNPTCSPLVPWTNTRPGDRSFTAAGHQVARTEVWFISKCVESLKQKLYCREDLERLVCWAVAQPWKARGHVSPVPIRQVMRVVEIRGKNWVVPGIGWDPVALGPTKRTKLLPPNTFPGLEIYQKCFCGRRSALDPMGGFQRFQGPLDGFRGPFRSDEESEERRQALNQIFTKGGSYARPEGPHIEARRAEAGMSESPLLSYGFGERCKLQRDAGR